MLEYATLLLDIQRTLLGAHAGQTLTYHRAYIVDISPYLKVVANQPYGSRRPVEQIALRLSTCYPRCLQSMFFSSRDLRDISSPGTVCAIQNQGTGEGMNLLLEVQCLKNSNMNC
jgi:hypothetical protein